MVCIYKYTKKIMWDLYHMTTGTHIKDLLYYNHDQWSYNHDQMYDKTNIV